MELGIAIVEYRVDPSQMDEVNRRLMEHVAAAARRHASVATLATE